MKEFLAEKLYIARDGVLNINEAIAIAIIVVLALLTAAVIRDLLKKNGGRNTGHREVLFRHRKNRYKNHKRKRNKH